MFYTRIFSFFALLGFYLLSLSPAVRADEARYVPDSQSQVQLSFAPIVKHVTPAVVNIYTSKKVAVQQPSPFMADPMFQHFFGGQGGFGGMPRERVVSSLGSGVIIDPQGIVVTNNHVIVSPDDIRVVLADRREYKAQVVIADASSDLTLLRLLDEKGNPIKNANFPALDFVNSDSVQVGDLVLAVGNPFGVGQSVTSGIVSALARPAGGISDFNFFIQTDAAINPGNSGGALVNMKGDIIGINTAIYSRTGGSNGIGFAIPSNMVVSLIQNIQPDGSIARPWIGAGYQEVTPDIAKSLGMDTPTGVLITDVFDDTPAAEAGLKSGDVILSLNSQRVDDIQGFKYRVATAPLNHDLDLTLRRNGKTIERTVKLELPPEIPARDMTLLKGAHPLGGMTVMNLSPRVAIDMGLNPKLKGVIVAIPGNSTAARLGFQKGDIIMSVNKMNITSTAQLKTLLADRLYGWNIMFQRDGQQLNLRVTQ